MCVCVCVCVRAAVCVCVCVCVRAAVLSVNDFSVNAVPFNNFARGKQQLIFQNLNF